MLLVLLAEGASGDIVTFSISWTWLYGIVGAALASLSAVGLKAAWPHIRAHFAAVWRLRRAERALDDKSPGLWLAPSIPLNPPESYQRALKNSKPIIVVANLKGGVGKTTTVANLIGHYGLTKSKKILALDLDFQGSLSVILLSEANFKNALEEQADGRPSKAAQLIDGRDASWVRNTSVAVDGIDTARCIPSYYTLAITENRTMVEWLIAKRKDDIRYSLAKVLHDKAIQDKFDLVLIDAPPRLTTGCIQALCAATHVLIPTVLDGLSAEATGGFVGQLVANQRLWPHLKLLGAFGNMTQSITADLDGSPFDGRLEGYEDDARTAATDAIREALNDASVALRERQALPLFPEVCFIPHKAELGNAAGNRIGYRPSGGGAATQQLSRAYDRLGDEIDRRISAAKLP